MTAPIATERTGAVAAVQRPGESADSFLQLLGRALRQFHTYSAGHPVCVDAIAACRKALLGRKGGDELVVRVTGSTLYVGEQAVACGGVGDQLLVSRLHRARVAELTISHDASARDLSRLCLELRAADEGASLADRLAEHGVTTIGLRLVPRPELLDVDSPGNAQRDLVTRERRRREEILSRGTATGNLYPSDKGWVRVDPAVDYRTFSLTDLSILVDDPAELAGMLARLGDEDDGADPDSRSALERKFGEVARLFASLDPRLSRVMFAKLARVVLRMEPERRRRLLRETVLTGLLDGKAEGAILHDFPDPDLAESLCLLLDLETAAPEVVTTALDRLGLSDERRSAVAPLVDAQIRNRVRDNGARTTGADLDQYARRLTKMSGAQGMSFTEFAAFDLSLDHHAGEHLARLQREILATDDVRVRLDCLANLVGIERNPEVVSTFLQSTVAGLGELQKSSRWDDLALQGTRLRNLAATLRDRRPEVAEAIGSALAAFCTRDLANALVMLHQSNRAGRVAAEAVVDAFADSLAEAFAALIVEELAPAALQTLNAVLGERASIYAAALAPRLTSGCSEASAVAIVRILGHAGPGNEAAIGDQLVSADETLARESLRALARIGTPQAAGIVAAQLTDGPDWIRAAALEALLRFPPAVTREHARSLLARIDLAFRHPAVVSELLERTARSGTDDIEDVLAALARLRFRFWLPGVSRLGRRARSLLAS